MASQLRIARLAVLGALAAIFALPPQALLGQEASEAKRKIKSQVTPVYPDLAKRMNVHGKVKLEVIVAPDGSVKSIHALGGHPVLVSASQDAVRNWKFEPGPKETIQMVEVNFD
jgi:TonB family protein